VWNAIERAGSDNIGWWLGQTTLSIFGAAISLFLGLWWVAAAFATLGLAALILVVAGARALMRPGWPRD
jgi:hypothetical protein